VNDKLSPNMAPHKFRVSTELQPCVSYRNFLQNKR